ncbi:putative endoplasmic reticulum transmembrane protein 3 [Glarea lozoyensis 74030]|uniref:Endoplasmic reticulum transmembrane protein n=1 Tax=Glarea lozoyensis (strain ATCC 74030 / MF5533) TaxID=1104152 RepID=H0EVL4_GLAL7|nr:putative endoplasmic reticulum transmembrane protein 3 [Glarea lozoyensis 74030]
MTLYYSLVFVLLVAEMALFMLLIVPLPFTIRRRMFTFIVNRVYRVQVELAETNKNAGGTVVMGHERMEVQARKFYSQRNMYLCGFTLFLSLILNRTYTMILDVLRLEEKVKAYEGSGKVGGEQTKKLEKAGQAGANEIGELKKQLANKTRDFDALKKQSQGLSAEYNRLGDEKSPVDTTPKKDR